MRARRCRRAFRRPRRSACAFLAAIAVTVALSCAPAAPEPETAESRPSVLLIVIDALRADHLGAYGYGRPTSPRIDEWAAGGRLFERAYATSPWTLPSFGSMLTGRLPSAHGAGIEVVEGADALETEVVAARNFVTLSGSVPTVAELLADQGFATGAFVTNPFLDPRFGLDRGFEDYDHYQTSNRELRPAGEVVDLSLRWLDQHSGRVSFLLVHLFDPHLDYDPPPPFRGRFAGSSASDIVHPVTGLWPIRNRVGELTDAERAFIAAAYDEEIAYVDEQIGRLFDEMQERGWLEDTLVLLTSDHGEEFFEHGGFEHGHSMYEEVIRVPLIIWGPGVAAGRDPRPVSLVDLMPTVLAATGVPVPDGLPGRSLLASGEEDDRRTVVAERVLYGPETKAIIDWPHKAVLDLASGEARLFDLERDPGEREDLARREPERLRDMLARLSERLEASRAIGAGVDAPIDDELRRRLRALGYIR